MKYIIVLFCLLISIQSISQARQKNILITYYSVSNHTKQMAEEVAKGANSLTGVKVHLKSIQETKEQDLLAANAIIVGSPVYNANVAPEVIRFIDSWPFDGYPLKNKIGAAFVSSGGISAGEELVQVNLLHTMLVFGMIVVGGDDWQSAFGASAITDENVYKPGQIDKHFLKKGFGLGKRVAELSLRLN